MFSLSDLTKDYEKAENLSWIKHHLAAGNLHWHDMETGEEVSGESVAQDGIKGKQLCGFLNFLQITQRNKFSVGDRIEVMKPDGSDVPVLVGAIYDENFEPQESAPHAKQRLWVWLIDDKEFSEVEVDQGDVLRVKA
ncbi:MAG: U32 family peptidase C-terminal domain-containing protein [Lachnospiraceae bacterium]|nr:U32 family peptidase C-terminal domain-containing protein [Lachnospiraceae bacterium]